MFAPPSALATPEPPPACYANKPSVTAIDQRPCKAPGDVYYEQNAHQPTYEGANPMVPHGTNPHVPQGTGQYNSPSQNS